LERDHAKEKQKLVKDKDAGAYCFISLDALYSYFSSQKPVDKNKPDQDQDGESRPRVAKGLIRPHNKN